MTDTIAASQFKATCLEILDRMAERRMDEVAITKHGRVVGFLHPPPTEAAAVDALFGGMRDFTFVREGTDLTAPLLDEELTAERDRLHG